MSTAVTSMPKLASHLLRGTAEERCSRGTTVDTSLAFQDTPVADAKPDDIKDLLGGALFKALFKWMQESGPVYLLPTGHRLCTITCMTALFQPFPISSEKKRRWQTR